MKHLQQYRRTAKALTRCKSISFSDSALHQTLPISGGIYMISSKTNGKSKVLYIGKATSIRQRLYQNLLNGQLRSHTLSRKLISYAGLKNKRQVKNFLKMNCVAQWTQVQDERERSFVEHYAIAHFRCPLND